MKVVIELCRVRERDQARAILGRVTCEAIDFNAAVEMARTLARTLDVPQTPDIVRISDDCGRELFRGPAERREPVRPDMAVGDQDE